ncbi:hypothetical protein TRVA0_044S00496 [Trichomonascus vanleenenianus]|uniref:NUDIX hydrolase n=1 Tax=Trichomonascus vanleenenianus TaxID=2268995 RepID=UPI003ECB6B2C
MTVVQALAEVAKREEVLVEHPEAPRRSSVAIIVRFRGRKLAAKNVAELIAELAAAEHVDDSAELLFIKRAASDRDRWSAHIALPGGRRDPEDVSDVAAAVREASEEVGLDLTRDAIYVGPLDQHLLKVSWGSRVIMTLCPFVFVMTEPELVLQLQPTEVAAAFWHPVSKLLDPQSKGFQYINVGERLGLANHWFIPRWFNTLVKLNVGDMVFRSVDMHPVELELPAEKSSGPVTPLLPPFKVWGLTLGYLTDFFELISPGSEIDDYFVPTLKAWDIRLIIYIISYRHVSRNRKAVKQLREGGYSSGNMDLVAKLFDGYFKYLRRGIAIALCMRASAFAALACWWYFKVRR